MKSRADRRQAAIRAKERVKRHIRDTWFMSDPELVHNKKFIGKLANTPHPCSGSCCGNPRRHYKGKDGLTIQERRELEGLKQKFGSLKIK
jgi:hypothetical protein